MIRSYALTRLHLAVDKLRAAEPAWLATKRKPIAGGIATAIAAFAARHGFDVTRLDAELLGLAVGGLVSYAIPNKRATGGNP